MIVLTSGGFDLLHVGHLDYLEAAASMANRGIIIALNSDEYIIQKKGYCLMPWSDRARILSSLRIVDKVIPNNGISDVLRLIHPNIFAYGGDRFDPDQEGHRICLELGIKELFGIGGSKIRSSGQLISQITDKMKMVI